MVVSRLFFLPSVVILSRGGEEDITTGVEGGLNTILYDTNDETNGDSLHGDIIANAKE